jgi:ABC-2 type transport system ATP-binding protein
MISIEDVRMDYPVPKKYADLILHPFSKKYFTALHKINFEINEGDRIAFLGSNGAGKTTLLKLIGGLLYPASGNIYVNGYNTIKQNLSARKCVGFVLNEERSFYWRLTGIQNLRFFGALDNWKGTALERKIEELIKLVGLESSANKLFAGYSSGMKQRLAIARGLLSDPDILILDEPTRTLDPVSADDVKNIITQRIHEKKERTLLIATHKLDEAQDLCNKVCIMKSGYILRYSSLEELLTQYVTLDNCYKSIINTIPNS